MTVACHGPARRHAPVHLVGVVRGNFDVGPALAEQFLLHDLEEPVLVDIFSESAPSTSGGHT